MGALTGCFCSAGALTRTPRAKKIYADARANGQHTKKEARRILKRHLSDVIHRRMIRDLASLPAQPSSLPNPARPPRNQG